MAQTIKLKRSGTEGNIPTTSQLELGEVAINTYDGKMFIKKDVGGTESIVEISAAAADAILVEYQFTSTASQTTYSGSDDNTETLSYTPNAIQVFMNGILLDPGIDFTATNGTSIVLSEAADANDYLQIFAFKKKISDGQVSVDTFTGDDSTTAFTLSVDPGDENNTRVFIDGVYQSKDNYSVSGTTLTFSTAPPTGTAIEVEIGNRVVTLDTLSDLDLPDDVKLRLGTSQDLQIYHDGSNSYIDDTGTGDLYIRANNLRLQNADGSEGTVYTNNGGNVELYYAGSKKLETTNDGVSVTGDVEATGEIIGDLRGATLFKAQAGESLAKGEVVYISGISGNTTVVSKADADDASKMPAFGIVAAAASSGNPVDIYTAGIIADIDTSSYSEGDELFVSTTAGALTATAPTGESAALQKIGKVTRSDATGGRIFIIGAGRSNAVPNLNEGRLFVGNSSNQAVADDTVHVDIANSRVGIGTTSPVSNLHVKTSVDNSVSQGIVVERSANTDRGYINYNGGGFQFRSTVGDPIVFGETDAEHMRIQPDGNVGIGTASPGTHFDLVSSTASTLGAARIQYSGANNYEILRLEATTDNDSILSFKSGSTSTYYWGMGVDYSDGGKFKIARDNLLTVNTALTIDSSQNIGIGTSSPATGLHLVDRTLRLQKTASDRKLEFIDDRTGANHFSIEHDTQQLYFYNVTTTEAPLLIKNNGDVTMTAGNVGIGTASPAMPLHVQANGTNIRMQGVSPDTYGCILDWYDSSGSRRGYIGHVGAGSDMVVSNDEGSMVFNTSASEAMRITAAGNVGVGTASPSQKLQVSGTGTPTIRIEETTSGGSKRMDMWVDSSTAIGYIGANQSAQSLGLQTVGSTRMLIDPSGNVGIGTSSPASTLHVDSSSGAVVRVSRLSANAGAYGQLEHDGTLLTVTSTGDTKFYNNAGESMRILSGGNVGIGVTNPSTKLAVAGSLSVTSNITNNSAGHAYLTLNSGGVYESGIIYQRNSTSKWETYISSSNDDYKFYSYGDGDVQLEIRDGVDGNGGTILSGLGVSDSTAYYGSYGALILDSNASYTASARSWMVTNALKAYNFGILYSDSATTKPSLTTYGDAATGTSVALSISNVGDVGIGTDAPFNSANYKTLNIRGTNGGQILLGNSSQSYTGYLYTQSSGTVLGAVSGTRLELHSGGTEKVRIDANGNVGIGTSNPQTALHIYDTPAEIVRMQGNDEYAYASFYGTVSASESRLGYMGFANDTSTAADFNFANNQGGIFSFNSDVHIGISSSYPATTAALNVRSNTSAVQQFAIRVNKNNYADTGGHTTLIGFGNEPASWSKGAIGFQRTTSYDVGDFLFCLNSNAASGTDVSTSDEKMRLDSSGNLLIGTTVASAKLYAKTGAEGAITKFEGPAGRYVYSGTDSGGHYMEVVGTQASERVLRIQGNNGSGSYTQLFIDAGNQNIYTSTNCNVGIGTSAPSVNLQVKGGTNAFAAHFGQGQDNGSGSWGGISLGYNENNIYYRKVGIVAKATGDNAARQELHFLVDTANDQNSAILSDSKMMINTGGLVAIGQTTAAARLDIKAGSTGEVGLNISRSSSSGRAQFTLSDESGTNVWRVGMTGPASEDFAFFDGGANVVTLYRSTNGMAVSGDVAYHGGRHRLGAYHFSDTSNASGSTYYVHFKTSQATNTVQMTRWEFKGYNYGASSISECDWACHVDSSGNIYNKTYNSLNTSFQANNIYASSDGYVVLVASYTVRYYLSGAINIIDSPIYTTQGSTISAHTITTSNSGAY